MKAQEAVVMVAITKRCPPSCESLSHWLMASVRLLLGSSACPGSTVPTGCMLALCCDEAQCATFPRGSLREEEEEDDEYSKLQ